ncbi:hypothetical protein [Alphabaculovirus altersperidaniae]|uniref:Uncharacterized protein n=1 Tax=Spodoptera eridania nucleopolyhedrovirus TaxID=2315721 RepID=A0ABX6TRR4_9ABAC|nr:hypothetical protein QKS47_gp116 [Spodoptera eridania nucleopolyhedrovirus]QNV47831.1 hypothetical protein [Spodoptera eridania nucleopolyhedrovirus]
MSKRISSGAGKSGAKRKTTATSKIGEMMGFKRKQPDKNLISTANKPINYDNDDDDLSNLEAAINESSVRSPLETASSTVSAQHYPNYDPDPGSFVDDEALPRSTMDVDDGLGQNGAPVVILVKPPTMNQIGMLHDNVRDIQLAINIITQYMNALQRNISPTITMTTKQYFTFFEPQVNKLAYKTIMMSILNNNTVNRENFYALSNMFYYYYIKLFDNIIPLAHVIVNVNYTHGTTHISYALTGFINSCAHYVVSNIKQLFSYQSNINISNEYYRIITDKQHCLTNLYNFKLNDLRNVLFIKHTRDNDTNTFGSEAAENSEDHVIDIPIHVSYNLPNLKFE